MGAVVGGGDKNDGGKEKGGGEKKEAGPPISVFKMDMHCEGCADKIRRIIKRIEGVESVNITEDKLTVTGAVNASHIKETLERKTKKEVVIVSAPKNKDEKKTEEKKPEEKKPPKESTVVLKINLHCEGCISKIKKILKKNEDVNGVEVDPGMDIVTVKGTMDAKKLMEYLTEKLRRRVEQVPPAKKDKEKDKTCDDKQKECGGGRKNDVAPEYPRYGPPSFWYDGTFGNYNQAHPVAPEYPCYGPPSFWYDGTCGNYNQAHPGYSMVPVYENYRRPMYQAFPGYGVCDSRMFSDENPNSCSVM